MATLNKEQFFNTLSSLVGERSDPEAIKALEDMTDTYAALTDKKSEDGVDWKAKAEEIDKSWREKYRQRFMRGDAGNGPANDNSSSQSKSINSDNITIKDLFK